MTNLREEIITEMQMAGINDIDGIIKAVCTAFDVEEDNQDVVDAIREDYLDKKDKKKLSPIKDYDYVLVSTDIEGNPVYGEDRVVKLDASYDKEIFDWLVENGIPCDQYGNEFLRRND